MLRIQHQDKVQGGFIDVIFTLATRMKAMLEHRKTLSRMHGGSQSTGQVRSLTRLNQWPRPSVLAATYEPDHGANALATA
ncbi:hypothetical protein DA456_26985 [Pseudomonas syringae pv. atrofaciens]|uniref:Uncharacterized protein n=1 Tax=Pseudomonas syringae pv. atrofaciens TaxID=192087 RepID=A0AAD0MY75_PSESX|nr:hypothetical protein DA456_26985 [Pseudomonas syringae pv. atrofaciens]